jgi:DNA modification methylase
MTKEEHQDSSIVQKHLREKGMKDAKGLPIVQMDWSERIKSGDGKFMGTETKSKGEPNMKNNHPTVKPLKLMQYLVRLVTPKNGIVLDPFGGSGTTGKACIQEGFNYILFEREEEYCKIARARVNACIPNKGSNQMNILPSMGNKQKEA